MGSFVAEEEWAVVISTFEGLGLTVVMIMFVAAEGAYDVGSSEVFAAMTVGGGNCELCRFSADKMMSLQGGVEWFGVNISGEISSRKGSADTGMELFFDASDVADIGGVAGALSTGVGI